MKLEMSANWFVKRELTKMQRNTSPRSGDRYLLFSYGRLYNLSLTERNIPKWPGYEGFKEKQRGSQLYLCENRGLQISRYAFPSSQM